MMTLEELNLHCADHNANLTYSHTSPDGVSDLMVIHYTDGTTAEQWVLAPSEDN